MYLSSLPRCVKYAGAYLVLKQQEKLEEAKELGPEGYILAPSHPLQPDVPPENIVAMYEEAKSYRAGLS